MAGSLDSILKIVSGAFTGQVDPSALPSELLPWVLELSKNSLGRWAMSGARLPCGIVHAGMHCHAPCIARCCHCNEPVCLRHAIVAITAEVVCVACMRSGLDALRGQPQQAHREAPPRPRAAPAPDPGLEEEKLRKKHLKTLGLPAVATWDEIKKSYRQLVLKYHPDRNQQKSPQKQAHARGKLVDINAAYAWLESKEQRSAA